MIIMKKQRKIMIIVFAIIIIFLVFLFLYLILNNIRLFPELSPITEPMMPSAGGGGGSR